jgi:hypothetical protein
MGYRSQVIVAFNKSLVPKFLDAIARSEDAKRLVFEWRDKYDLDWNGDGHHLIHWGHIKWYHGKDTAIIEDFVRANLEDARFIRIGEDVKDGDIDDFGEFGEWDLYPCVEAHIEGI